MVGLKNRGCLFEFQNIKHLYMFNGLAIWTILDNQNLDTRLGSRNYPVEQRHLKQHDRVVPVVDTFATFSPLEVYPKDCKESNNSLVSAFVIKSSCRKLEKDENCKWGSL